MMHGHSVPPQDPTLPPTMANSPFQLTDGSADGEDDHDDYEDDGHDDKDDEGEG